MPILGCIADDVTGGTDLANNLVKSGFRSVQIFGLPVAPVELAEVDAVVVVLKSRTLPATEAVAQSVAALKWLQAQGCIKFYFKYCSTFDSTPEGNIGPVTDALLDELGEAATIVCPAFPDNRRTLYHGHLFVGDTLLNESGMEYHPLTPMTDANIVRVLSAQTPSKVGLLRWETMHGGEDVTRLALTELIEEGRRMIVTETLDNTDLSTLARVTRTFKLVTGGSGLALGMSAGMSRHEPQVTPPARGTRLVLAGSASGATLKQVECAKDQMPSFKLEPLALDTSYDAVVDRAKAWAETCSGGRPVLIYGSGTPHEVRAAQQALGVRRAGELIESALADLARYFVARGVGQLIVAGGETSGAVLQALEVRMLHDREGNKPRRPLDGGGVAHGQHAASGVKVRQLWPGRHVHHRLGGVMTEDLLRERLVVMGQRLYARGLSPGTSGNLSVRLDDGWLLTPTNSCLGELAPEEISKLDWNGNHIGGNKPSKEAFLHLAYYRNRASANAIVHLHSTYAVAVSCLSGLKEHSCLPALTPYFVMRIGNLPLAPYIRPGDERLGDEVGRLAGAHTSVLLSNHGPVVSAADLALAVSAAEELEETAKLFLLLCDQPVRLLSDADIDDLRQTFGATWTS